jgi:hypothetical protein
VETDGLSHEEKLAFFINLYNMMIIHALVTCGHPSGPLDRRKFLETLSMSLVDVPIHYQLSRMAFYVATNGHRTILPSLLDRDQRSKVKKANILVKE